MSTLGVWGLGTAGEATYRALLRNPEHTVAQLASHLETDESAVRVTLRQLVDLGLVSRVDGGFVAGPPASVLASLVHSELADLESRRSELDAVRASLSSFAADHLVGQSRAWSSSPFELLSDEEAFVAVEDLQRQTTGEVLTAHPVLDLDVDSPTYVELVRRQLRAGRPMRAIYPADVVAEPARLAYVRRWAAAGEQVRIVRRPPPSVVVYGADAALVSAASGAGAGGSFLLYAPALIELAREVFACHWAGALPLSRLTEGTTAREDRGEHDQRDERDEVDEQDERDERKEILELLMLGSKDETIARTLGVSLRTVRRRVAHLMDDLGAATRFQAGMEAVRRGLL